MSNAFKGATLTKKFRPNTLCPLAKACCISPNAPQGAGRFEDQRPTGSDPEIPECWRGWRQGTSRGMQRRFDRVATPDAPRELHTSRRPRATGRIARVFHGKAPRTHTSRGLALLYPDFGVSPGCHAGLPRRGFRIAIL